MQIVIEFGCEEIEPLAACLFSIIGVPTRTEVWPSGTKEQGFTATEQGVASVLEGLRQNILIAAVFRTASTDIRYGLLTAPNFLGARLSLWMATVELDTVQWEPVWEELLGRTELCFVCAGSEEGLELTDDQLTAETFPWNDGCLLRGAVRAADGGCMVCAGSSDYAQP